MISEDEKAQIKYGNWIMPYIEVKKLSDKIVKRIDELKNEGFEDSAILASVRNYLLGISDGLDFAAEMNEN